MRIGSASTPTEAHSTGPDWARQGRGGTGREKAAAGCDRMFRSLRHGTCAPVEGQGRGGSRNFPPGPLGPAPTGKGTPIVVRVQPPALATLDTWIALARA